MRQGWRTSAASSARGRGPRVHAERPPPAADLAHVWSPRTGSFTWDLTRRPAHRMRSSRTRRVNLVFEPHGAAVFGVQRAIDARFLAGSGWAVGAKFRPGASPRSSSPPGARDHRPRGPAGRPVRPAGAGLARRSRLSRRPRLAPLRRSCARGSPSRPRRRARPRGRGRHRRGRRPARALAEIAARHAVSTRTLQRLFRRHVGVGPKWVLRRYRLQEAAEQLAAAAN